MAKAEPGSAPLPDPAALWQQAVAAYHARRWDEVEQQCRPLLNQPATAADARHLLGLAAHQRRDFRTAADWLAQAVAANPGNAEYHANLAAVRRALGDLAGAEAAGRAALALAPGFISAWNNLGNALGDQGRAGEAVAALREAIRLQPDYAAAHANLGNQLCLAGRYGEALAACRRSLELAPQVGHAWQTLGTVLIGQGDLAEAEQAFRRALALTPTDALAHSGLLFCLNYRSDASAEEIFAEYRRWDDIQARPLRPNPLTHTNDPSPERRLRVGYVSADFRHHAVSFFFEPLLAGHDKRAVELFCYAEVRIPDAVTERLRGLADHWRSIVGLDDQAVAELVRADAIDVLVDLTGHTAHGRLLAFARKPAPVQISYLIGAGYSSGLSAIDGFLADSALVPAGFDHLFSEQVIRLPRLPLCYRPPEAMPAVGPLPALARGGQVTFGSFSRPARINDSVVALWARLLQAVPGSRLLLNSKPFAEADSRAAMQARFAAHGIGAERLELVYTSPQPLTWAAYNQIDIALDPFPHNAGTTTVEALWMGVPVVSLADRPSVGRFGACILGGVGLADLDRETAPSLPNPLPDPPPQAGEGEDGAACFLPPLPLAGEGRGGGGRAPEPSAGGLTNWVATTPDQYLAIAAAAAADLPGLAALRAGLRARVQASPLCDGPGLARAIEGAYRQLWRQWCSATKTPRRRPAELDQAIAAFQRGDHAQADTLATAALAQVPDDGETLHVLGLIAYQSRRFEQAEALIRRALAAGRTEAEVYSNHGAALRALGRLGEAETAARTAIRLRPDFADAHNNLGNVLKDLRRHDLAIEAFGTALASGRKTASTCYNLGTAYQECGRLAEAEAAYRQALDLKPETPRAWADTWNNLGACLAAQERNDQAEAAYRQALRLKPDYFEGWTNLGALLLRCGRLFAAEAALRHAHTLWPDNPSVFNNLGIVYEDLGRLTEAEAMFRRALAVRTDHAGSHGSLLFCLNYRADLSAEAIFAEYRRWDDSHGRPHRPAVLEYANRREPERRLRIGYVSPDFRYHAVLLFFEPLLAAHDKSAVEVFCYAEVAHPDGGTERLRGLAEHWRSTVGLDDAAVAALVRADGIDVLIDLGGHTASSRLPIFARKPAPVQITYLIGHGYTSGMSAMDAFLADAAMVPAGFDHLFSERVIRLPRIPLCYQPPAAMPAVGPLPARSRGGRITFGSFTRTVRINERVIALWVRLLQAVPGSRLVLNSRPYAEPETHALFLARFLEHGLSAEEAAERVELIYTAPQPRTWAAYNDIDIALDPFPHNAGTTTIEALWMGVPVVSLADRPSVGRFGASILGSVGLSDWVAATPEQYVAIAVAAAADLDRLAALRAGLRARVQASPLCDGPGLARAMEAAYRQLWRDWCEAEGAPLNLPLPGPPPQAGEGAENKRLDLLPLPLAGEGRGGGLGNTGALYQTAATAWQAGNRTEARRVCQAVLQAEPDHPDALHLLGVLEQQDGRPAAAETLIRRAIARRPEAPAYHTNLAAVLRSLRRLDQAEAAARQALALAPDFADALNNLGNILRERGHPVEAIARFRKCLGLQPAVGSTHYNLGRALWDCGRAEEAVAAYQLALELDPGQVDAWNDLGAALQAVGRNVAAEAACRQAIALAPTQGRNHDTLGTVLLAQARLDEALTVYRHALTLTPPAQRRAMTILFCANYSPTLSAEDVFAEYRRMDQEVARPLLPASVSHGNTPQPGRRLRVGYVSPDLCTHTVSLFIEPLLAAHDKSAVELFCYAEVAAPDAVTRRLQGLADHWRSTVGLDDPAVADLIRADAIDILVDLGGHTASSRILVFARKPAPVQVTYLLGHGYTSGLSAMDAFLADATLAPAGCEALFSEKTVIRLPRTPLCYQPPEGMPAVGPLPARARGSQVTFGSFSRSVRFNDRVIALWARLLRTVPGARLLLNTRAFAEGETRARFLARFARHGIAPERLELICTTASAATWAAYTQVDIALDPFPHNAGTTTIEALWMGIPVVTLADRPSVGRFGASILGSLGLSEWVATTPDQYVAIAAAAAADLDRLAAVRAGLRPRFQASPLRDGPGLARAIEAAYRQLWQGWCAARTTPPNPISAGEIAAVIALFNAGRDQELEATARALTERCPGDGFGWKALATALIRGRRREEGISAMQRALQCRPEDADAHNNLGIALKELGRFDQAVASYRRALALKPDYIEVLSNLGNALKELGRVDEAEASLRQALALNPDHTEALNNLGYLLTDGGRLHQARSLLQRALALRPGYPEAFNNLGRVHKELGDLEDAVACFRRALALKPETGAYNNLLFCLNYAPELPAEAIFAEYQRWDQSCARPLRPNPLRHDNERSPERRLRVGYVSADFGFHVVSMFFAPLLTAHDRAAVEVFCYSEVRVPDAMTERLRGLADHWRSIVGVKDQAVADLIRADGIDVLVDLTGHTAHGRLLVFARKPAPIQVSYLIGTGYSSGLSAMDAFLADADMVPAGFDHLFSERVIRLPRSPLCYQPPAAMPAVGPLSALSGRLAVPSLGRPLPGPPPQAGEGEERAACFLPPLPRAGEGRGGGLARTGPITFGSFTRTVRINQRVIALWARVLQAVPGSRLLLNNKPFLEADCRALFEARFAAHGITADRLELVYTSPQPQTWAAYNQIDIALDPFPHNAGTTTLEALWMGVPVISLADRPSVGRFGASILGSVGLADWVAATPDQYVAIAVAAAGDLDRLAALRAGLRARVEASPLRDGPGLARAIEEAYRQLWRQWCVGNGVG